MIVALTNPQGVDYWINKLQSYLQENLFSVWGIDANDEVQSAEFVFYPRVHRNPSNNGFIAELYTGDGEYNEVYYDDSVKKGFSWFGLGPRIQKEVDQVADIHLVTFADLSKIYPDISHRADNEIRIAFERLFAAPIFGFTLISTEIWLANVLREYPGSRRDDRLMKADMGTTHAFRLNLSLRFDPDVSCPNPIL